jgi:hypothetical protein
MPIRITDERWMHVVESHDYIAGNRELVVETVEDPDAHVVVYREFENDGFRITACMMSAPETILRKGVIWQRPQTP